MVSRSQADVARSCPAAIRPAHAEWRTHRGSGNSRYMTQTTWTEARIMLPATEGGHAADQGMTRVGPEGWVHVRKDGGGFASYPPKSVFSIVWLSDPWVADQ